MADWRPNIGVPRAGRDFPETHGLSRTPEYRIWKLMRQRCSNPNNDAYRHYGGRGIRVCSRWEASAQNFIDDMGRRPSPRHKIERRNNDLGYNPDNCCWATSKEQSSNTRRNVKVTFQGDVVTLSEASRRAGLNINTVYRRLSAGWTVERALSEPPRKSGRWHK